MATIPIENKPGAAADLLRRLADEGVNVDLLYLTVEGRLVLGGPHVPAIKRAIG